MPTRLPLLAGLTASSPGRTSPVVNICTKQQEILGREEGAVIRGECTLVSEQGAAEVFEGNLGSSCPTPTLGRGAEWGLSVDTETGVRGGLSEVSPLGSSCQRLLAL